ncbi:MAG: efflux RND transporter periplasmic adaptor subunit [Rhodobacteraceae bacterium]|nr:efflux RND transporter periplasmic adaptor subunit [Paracoccaceae bacterium]
MTTRILCAIALLASGLLLLGLAGPAAAQQPGQGAPMAVTVVTLQPQTITLTTTLPGRVAASAEAEVRPQVNGIILDRLFKEGAHVDAGDPLYEIDPATYKAAVAQARAAVQQAQVQYDNAVTEAQRLNELQSRKVASQQALDNAQATRDAAAAAMQVAEAQLSQAQIDLDRTTIRARLSGEIGLSQTSPGALVTASQADPLAVIRKLDPVYVDVTQSAADLLRWRRGQSAEVAADADKQVELILADGSTFDHKGTLTAAEPHVDPQTGVVTLRMEFANPDQLLLPGMYVQVKMPTVAAHDIFLAPMEAVVRDRRGRPVAWVVNKDNVVEERQLTVLQDHGNDWVVSQGLEPGDRMVVAGFQKTAPGATVKPEDLQAAAAPAADGSAPAAAAPAQ